MDDQNSEQPVPTKKFWTFIKSRKNDGSGVSPLKDQGVLITDNKRRADLLNKQFQSAFGKKESYNEQEFFERCNMAWDESKPVMGDITVTQEGVEKLLRQITPTKAAGPDGVSPRYLREVACEIAPVMTKLFQISLDTGKIPVDWKHAHVSPIFKKGERYRAENYRPISLTSLPCKLLEHIIVSAIMEFSDTHSLLCAEQHGFRKSHSCETQLIGLIDEVSHTLEQGHQQDLLVMDFSKAFDKVNHSLLLHKLRCMGVQGNTNNWITEFLQDRTQAVIIDGSVSDLATVESGVPQGSVLGPTLFLLYINDLPRDLTSKARLFADDTACHLEIRTATDHCTLQQDLDKLAAWEERWSMKFHPEKCMTMHMSRSRNTIQIPYTLHGHTLEQVTEAKYLGVTLANDLKWSSHVQGIAAKANKTLGFIRRNIKVNNKKLKGAAYKALVRPILEYGSAAWDPYTQEDIDILERVQRRAARWVSNRFRKSSSVGEMLQELRWPTLERRRRCARLTMFYRVHHGMAHINSKFHPLPSTRRRRVRSTHNSHYDLPSTKRTYRQKSFFPRTIPEWNSLPEDSVSETTLASFKARLVTMQ